MPRFEPIDLAEALDRLLSRIDPVEATAEPLDPSRLAGRVLAEPVGLDRDSPACDVSAMDGYAVRLSELQAGPLPVVGECRIGQPPETLPERSVLRIYTGSPLPNGADTVVRLERAREEQNQLTLDDGRELTAGADIRRRGENAQQGDPVLAAGTAIGPAAMTALATIGPGSVGVRRPIRLAVLTTGDELLSEGEAVLPWRLRDSNGPSLAAMFSRAPWIDAVDRHHATDSPEAMAAQLKQLIDQCDAVVLTGGVSKGAHDYVPAAVEAAGGELLFHRLNARPGRPTLGAACGGKPILGLPGNPLAVLTAGRRVLGPALRRRAGFAAANPPPAQVKLAEWTGVPLPIAWWRPVRVEAPGVARLASLRGSGDTCGPAMTDGFVEVPPKSQGIGPYPYFPWIV